jgi:hypothetical protein
MEYITIDGSIYRMSKRNWHRWLKAQSESDAPIHYNITRFGAVCVAPAYTDITDYNRREAREQLDFEARYALQQRAIARTRRARQVATQ